jgi:transcriptional regulator with XRE-family HTH domain
MKEQTARLNQVLKTAIGALGFSLREVERRLGLSRGYLTRLFAGEMDLKIDHVVEIAGVLGVEPEEIFRLAFPASQNEPNFAVVRVREACGVPTPAAQPVAPPSEEMSDIEREIDRIVNRALSKALSKIK